jgi:DNA (cytosine-5)-methyltransferase 1
MEHTIAYSKSHRDSGLVQARGKIDDEANTLSTGDGCTSQSTGNYVFTKVANMSDIKFVGGVNPKKTWNKDDDRNLSRNYSQGERIHSPEGLSPCLSANMGGTANGSTLITESDMGEIEVVAHDGSKYESNGRIYGDNGIAPCIGARDFKDPKKVATLESSTVRIRKLTPTECERLQGYPDGHTKLGKKEDGTVYEMSNTQRYKMCGNGVSAPVPAHLFPAIFGNDPIRVMSLFSGCGGTELLLPPNFQVVGHCEFDKHASAVLNYHYPNIPNFHDVTQFVDKEVPEFDMLVGGFPCQSWSIAGLRKGFEDQRGQLIYNVFDILRKHKPKFLCLENVKGLLSKDKGDAFEAIMGYLSSLGYELDFEVVNSKDFGLAQNRQRVFIFGKLK